MKKFDDIEDAEIIENKKEEEKMDVEKFEKIKAKQLAYWEMKEMQWKKLAKKEEEGTLTIKEMADKALLEAEALAQSHLLDCVKNKKVNKNQLIEIGMRFAMKVGIDEQIAIGNIDADMLKDAHHKQTMDEISKLHPETKGKDIQAMAEALGLDTSEIRGKEKDDEDDELKSLRRKIVKMKEEWGD